MKRKLLAALLVIVLTLTVHAYALAQDDDDVTHIYGIVFYDANGNGVWDPGEQPATGIPVVLESADGRTVIELTSAPANDEIAEGENTCDPLTSDTPCGGTWGITPAGVPDSWWQVYIPETVDATVISENPQWVQVQGEGSEELVQFGLAPTGAGGPAPGDEPLMPATGSVAYEILAAGLLLFTGAGLMMKSRRRK